MTEKSGVKERHTSTIKVTPEILKALERAAEYYGNVSTLAKMMGVAHSTVIFWRTGKTSGMSGRLWVTSIRSILEPFLPSSASFISDTRGQYLPHPPAQPYQTKKVERHHVNVIPVSVLKNFDPALESASFFVRSRCTEKRSFHHECRRSSFALKIDDILTDVFPENSYVLAYPNGLQDGCIVICKLQGGSEILARKYSKQGENVVLSVLPGGTGEDISWNCEKEIGRLAWCFPLVELNLDLLPDTYAGYCDNDDLADDYEADGNSVCDTPKGSRKKKNSPEKKTARQKAEK